MREGFCRSSDILSGAGRHVLVCGGVARLLLLLGLLQFLLKLLYLLAESGEGFCVGHGGAVSSFSGSPDVGCMPRR